MIRIIRENFAEEDLVPGWRGKLDEPIAKDEDVARDTALRFLERVNNKLERKSHNGKFLLGEMC